MVQAMRRAIDACGVNVINDRGRFRSCLSDFLLDNAARVALLTAQDAGICASFLAAHKSSDAERNRAIGMAHARLTEDYGLSAERSSLILEVYAEGLGWKNYALPAAPVAQPTGVIPQSDIRFGPYDWQVLATQNNRALLLSKEIIEQCPYNDKYADVTWETCTLRACLNSNFYNTFTLAERNRIVKSTLQNPDNNWGRTKGKPFGTQGGSITSDHVFLLSVQDLHDYFGGLKLQKGTNGDEWNYAVDKRLAATCNGSQVWWWLRSPGIYQCSAVSVLEDGDVNIGGDYVDHDSGGVRPALWLNL